MRTQSGYRVRVNSQLPYKFSPMNSHKWQFVPRFRRNAFGWRSDKPIERIKEALSEIRQVARKEPVIAAEGAIVFFEKLSPALMNVDSSSGAIGTAVNRAIETLVPLMVQADVDVKTRQRWLERLWEAIQEDEMPYIEALAGYWGELCASKETAWEWADRFLPILQRMWSPEETAFGYFRGTEACLSAMLAAQRYEEVIALVEKARYKTWHIRRWGFKALVSMGRRAEAIRFAEASQEPNSLNEQISEVCEALLLSSGLADEAYARYGIQANQRTTYIATFRAIAKKYPAKEPETILQDLVRTSPGNEGKWFAAAKDVGLLNMAVELAQLSPTDPLTLSRAARDYATKDSNFSLAVGLASLHWMARGYGYELTSVDVLQVFQSVQDAGKVMGMQDHQIQSQVRGVITTQSGKVNFVQRILKLG